MAEDSCPGPPRAKIPPKNGRHIWRMAEVIDGPSHVGQRFEICVLCLKVKSG